MSIREFYENFIKSELIILFPFIIGFNVFLFDVSLVLLFIYYVRKKQLHIFFLLISIYKVASYNFVERDDLLLTVLTVVFSLFYTCRFFINFRFITRYPSVVVFLLFFTYTLLNSQQSVLPDLSTVKAFGFFISGTACVFVIFYFKESIVNLLCSLFNLLIITSVILPARLTTSNASLNLHSGILNHSQSYGYFLICALPLYLLKLKYDRKSSVYNYIIFFLGLYCVYLTGMRTAYFAVFSLYLIILFWDDIYAKKRLQLFFSFLLVFGSFLAFGRSKFIDKLIDKRGVEVGYEITSRQEMFESRNKLLAPSIENFRNHPILGIGFGVPSEATQAGYNMYDMWGIKYFPGTNFVISFPTEKGVLYSLILEELGIIGFVLFIMILIRGFVKKNHNLLLLIPLLTLSFGEGGLFSLNGIGVFGFILLLISVISDNNWSRTFAI